MAAIKTFNNKSERLFHIDHFQVKNTAITGVFSMTTCLEYVEYLLKCNLYQVDGH